MWIMNMLNNARSFLYKYSDFESYFYFSATYGPIAKTLHGF